MKKMSVYGATACGIGFASAAVALTGSSGEVSRSGISAASTAVKIGSEGSRITAAQGVASAVTVGSFLPSSADFPNPERGFYRWISPGFLDQWTQSDATDAYNNGYRILYARISLEDYKNVDTLPADLIARLNTGFGYARSAGVKLVVRFVYNYPSSETDLSAGDAPLARIKSHITQLSPLLRNNADVIAFLQAGFVGVWGEWHTSKNGFDDNAPGASNWAEVKDALLAAMPDDRFVQFRYPRHLMAWVPAASLPTVASAIQGKFRYGFHNDCFLSGVADIGTFSDDAGVRSQQRDYADRLGDVGPVGGETCDMRGHPRRRRQIQLHLSQHQLLASGIPRQMGGERLHARRPPPDGLSTGAEGCVPPERCKQRRGVQRQPFGSERRVGAPLQRPPGSDRPAEPRHERRSPHHDLRSGRPQLGPRQPAFRRHDQRNRSVESAGWPVSRADRFGRRSSS
jgi:hypothetical protein